MNRLWTTSSPIRRALLSVSDKRGLVDLARALADRGVHLLASGGTRTALAEAGLDVDRGLGLHRPARDPRRPGQDAPPQAPRRHPRPPRRPRDLAALEAQGIEPIDLVVVNLYPFEATVARPGVTLRGGGREHRHRRPEPDPGRGQEPRPCRRRSPSPDQYPAPDRTVPRARAARPSAFRKALALARLRADRRATTRRSPTTSASARSSAGDRAVPRRRFALRFERRSILRYGENPHQRAAFYVEPGRRGPNLATATILHGKELSYNNLLDLDSALRLIRQFAEPAAAILKHNNPCGAAIGRDPGRGLRAGLRGRPVSAFGGIVGLNRPVDRATAERICVPGRFLEAIVAPGFEPDALALLTTKPTWKNSVRLLDLAAPIGPDSPAAVGLRPPAHRGRPARPGLGRDRSPTRRRGGRRRSGRRRPRSGRRSASPGGSARRSSRTRSCWRRDGSSSASGPGR